MRRHVQTEVLVTGAGPVGMFTALRLAENGVKVKLIDQESCTAGRSYACALHPRTLQLLDEVGVARDAIKLGRRVDTIAFCQGADRRAEIDLSRLPVDFPFVLVLEQTILEDLLEQKLQERAGLKVHWNHRLADLSMRGEVATATIEELAMEGKGYIVPDFEMAVKKTVTAEADYVVGTDGQGSIVRQRLGIENERAGEPELFVVYELETEEDLPPEMRVVLDERSSSVVWPLARNKCRWSFQWLQADAPADFPRKDRDRFTIAEAPGGGDVRLHLEQLLRERAPWFKSGIKEVGWATDIQFEHRLARQLGRDQAWLAGDAAHQTGPVGMQSMNIGFREGSDLAEKLGRILRQDGSPDLLESYELERRQEWRQLLGWKGGPKPGGATSDWVRERSERLPGCIPASGQELTLLLRQLGLDFVFGAPEEVAV
jgi:2-polyprenyl-6-methoxyphenol hydroxylase-like FAD-dependent oxidoreductase